MSFKYHANSQTFSTILTGLGTGTMCIAPAEAALLHSPNSIHQHVLLGIWQGAPCAIDSQILIRKGESAQEVEQGGTRV